MKRATGKKDSEEKNEVSSYALIAISKRSNSVTWAEAKEYDGVMASLTTIITIGSLRKVLIDVGKNFPRFAGRTAGSRG